MKKITKAEAAEIFKERFGPGSEKRSYAYELGFRHQLESMRGNTPICPYKSGATECDAYFAGCDNAVLTVDCYLTKKLGA